MLLTLLALDLQYSTVVYSQSSSPCIRRLWHLIMAGMDNSAPVLECMCVCHVNVLCPNYWVYRHPTCMSLYLSRSSVPMPNMNMIAARIPSFRASNVRRVWVKVSKYGAGWFVSFSDQLPLLQITEWVVDYHFILWNMSLWSVLHINCTRMHLADGLLLGSLHLFLKPPSRIKWPYFYRKVNAGGDSEGDRGCCLVK